MEISYEQLHQYAAKYTEAEPKLLAAISHETYADVPMPNMLSGHLQGRILATFSHMLRPYKILEIGTYTGYSAICLAEGLQKGGTLYTIDRDAALESSVRSYFAQAGIEKQVQYFIGQALDIIPQLKVEFDLVFIDADKKNYVNYYDLAVDQVRPGGFILADNVLWKGKVVNQEAYSTDKQTQAIINFNNKVHHDPRVANVLFPIRDGLMVIRKK